MYEMACLELKKMNMEFDELSLIQSKDGISVWRVSCSDESYVLKCFEKEEYKREIQNYRILSELGISSLKLFNTSESSILMEDVEQSAWRLGVKEDLADPEITRLLAKWYRLLHERGRNYSGLSALYDETELITHENLTLIQNKTNTADYPLWRVIETNLDSILARIRNLPRTLVFNDFYYTNLIVAKDKSKAFMFDYNLMGQGYVYSDLRNVCSSLSHEAADAFLAAYGDFDPSEIIIDQLACVLVTLSIACQREQLPCRAGEEIDKIRNGELESALETLLSDFIL